MRREKGAEIRVYSGSSAGLQSGTRNHVPVTMVEINLEPHASAELEIAASYNGFAFVIDGSVRIGDTELNTGQVGWLDRPTDNGTSVLRVVAGESGARLICMRDSLKETRSYPMVHLLATRSRTLPDSLPSIRPDKFPRLSELKKQ